jgi:hypothetical protein
MSDSSPQVFQGVAPEQYARLVQKARSAGIEMSGESGRASRMGVEVEWNYSAAKQELTLTCIRTPFFMSAQDVNEKLRAVVKDSLEV